MKEQDIHTIRATLPQTTYLPWVAVPASDLGKKRHNGDAGGTSSHPSGFGDAGAGHRGRARTGAAGADVAAARRARVGVVEPILVAQGLCLQFVRYRVGTCLWLVTDRSVC